MLLLFGAVTPDEGAARSQVAAYFKVYLTHPGSPWTTWEQARPLLTPGLYQLVKQDPHEQDLVGGSCCNGQFKISALTVKSGTAVADVELYGTERNNPTKVNVKLLKLGNQWRIDDLVNWDAGSLRDHLAHAHHR